MLSSASHVTTTVDMHEEGLRLVVPPRTPSRKLPVREGHFGVKCILVGLSVVAVVVVCFAVRCFPLPSSPELPSHRILTANPIIGIVSQPLRLCPESECIASSYIKWVESAGARAVRIPSNATDDDVARILSSVNGVLFPGNGIDPSRVASFIYNHAVALNQNGTHFPIWGTGLGMEWLVQLESRSTCILDAVNANNMSSTLGFTRAATTSNLFGFSAIFAVMGTQSIAAYFHSVGILADRFDETPALTSFFRVTIEFPFYGVQFHPEMNAYEFDEDPSTNSIDHSYNAILTSQALAHFFVSEARRNNHRFRSPQAEFAALLDSRESSDLAIPTSDEILLFNSTL
ncbi:hypothetical protein DYB32_007010 [Aphanomyces invadans]|uniref:folate gamma-glutamyl hydrolase n=1 Tax=Aphanomyces invadans TaxID=157072 RepID=A0A418APQ8_9STRA|nr:hypothetical protein DYB32_007010 [Aphanomyces invadans]